MTGFITAAPFGMPEGLIGILIISFLVTLFQILVYKKMTDQERLKELQKEQKDLQQKLKETKDMTEMQNHQKKMMELTTEMLKHNMKPMIVTFLPLIIVFYWLKHAYISAGVGNIISWGVKLPIVGDGGGWLFCYIVFSLVFSVMLRKAFKLH